jgi:DNA replication protein DnaC
LDIILCRHETKLIEEVVVQIWKKLELKFSSYYDGLVAIDARLEELYSILKLGSEDICFIGIWGMGGIGKTTLTTALFKKIKSQFDVSCFIANVREVSGERNQGLLQLQNKILSYLNIKGMVIETLSQGKDSLRNLLSNKKVLLVLDDVSSKTQLESLPGKP